ncbi:MAG: CotH kinase family protein [Bacteroidetes bacterium]|nr:CotH kinase family protein [Bacteroidota bacterium]
MTNKTILILGTLISAFTLSACKKVVFVPSETSGSGIASHDNGFDANYDVVFDDSKVHRIDFVLSADEWSDMQADLADKTSGGGGPGGTFSSENPDYFPCDVHFNDLEWKNVGIRYKGNSSLRARSGKLPLRLDFDQFEDDYPEILNQRFYGFKELSMSSNYNDASLMREKSADDLFRDFGVPAVHTAFYEVYIDNGNGNGPEYYGVYTMCEVIFDTYLKSEFGSKSGNCYKPENDGAQFDQSSFNLEDFALKTNEEIGDKSDIQQMFDYLHASTRTSDVTKWKNDLESVFDVDGFLKYLAVNNTIQNWDTYGRMSHNYYLYNDPADNLIKWIVWDNNEAFEEGKMGGAVSFGMSEIGIDWPLINYIIADAGYLATYKAYIKSFIETSFETSRMSVIYSNQETLLNASANAERSGYSYVNGQFSSAVSTLKSHNVTRVAAAQDFID